MTAEHCQVATGQGTGNGAGQLRGGGEQAVNLPVFDGADPNSWLARAEQQFDLHGIREAQRTDLAMVFMEGTALGWFC